MSVCVCGTGRHTHIVLHKNVHRPVCFFLSRRCMVYACPWSDAERRALALAVCQHGCRWAFISRLGLVPGRSPTALRLEFLRNPVSLVVAPESAPPNCVVCQPGCIAPWPPFSRSRFAGRPWQHYIRPRRSSRSPTPNQAALIAQFMHGMRMEFGVMPAHLGGVRYTKMISRVDLLSHPPAQEPGKSPQTAESGMSRTRRRFS